MEANREDVHCGTAKSGQVWLRTVTVENDAKSHEMPGNHEKAHSSVTQSGQVWVRTLAVAK
jgi:hypothetical protein